MSVTDSTVSQITDSTIARLDSGCITPERMRRLRRLAVVPRWTVIPTINRQNVADHSFHVTWIAIWLAKRLNINISVEELMLACLIHDESEAISGDIAAPFKKGQVGVEIKMFEQNREMGARCPSLLRAVIKAADLLEASLFMWEDQRMGNQRLAEPVKDIHRNFETAWEALPWCWPSQKPEWTSILLEFLHHLDPDSHPALEEL